MIARVRSLMDHIESLGGAVRCVENGWYRGEIARAAYEHQKRIESGETVVVGVNRFRSEAVDVPETLKVNPHLEQAQIARLTEMKSRRDRRRIVACLARLREVAASRENVVPAVIEAVENYLTVGEIADVFREAWGEYREQS